jgi:CBS-domain-containing membrane protein
MRMEQFCNATRRARDIAHVASSAPAWAEQIPPTRSRIAVNKQTPRPEFVSELFRPSDRGLSAKLVPTFADRGCHVVSVTDPYGRILGFLDRSRYFFFQVAPQWYSRD